MAVCFFGVLQSILTGRIFGTGIKGRRVVTRAHQPGLYWINIILLIGFFFLGLTLFLGISK